MSKRFLLAIIFMIVPRHDRVTACTLGSCCIDDEAPSPRIRHRLRLRIARCTVHTVAPAPRLAHDDDSLRAYLFVDLLACLR